MTKVELFEIIRKDFFVNGKSKRSIARNHHIHRRVINEALKRAIPPQKQIPERQSSILTESFKQQIDQWITQDQQAPRKQRHTAVRIYQRLRDECGYTGSEGHLRRYVGKRKREFALSTKAFVPQLHIAGHEAEVDWYEAYVNFPLGKTKVYFFQMRACYSGREFHIAFLQQTQQAFLEAHVKAFEYFGGVFSLIRYDNLSSAVKRVLKGRRRIETERFVILRSHYLFDSVFCIPGVQGAHEKGGVECGVGRFRRHHLVPVPDFNSLDELNIYLKVCCQKDDLRIISGKQQSIISDWQQELLNLMPLPKTGFITEEIFLAQVNKKSLVRVKNNDYSVPVHCVEQKVEVRLSCELVIFYHAGKKVAQHRRLIGQGNVCAELVHYLSLLRYKPGALAGSVALSQAKENRKWPDTFNTYWRALKDKYGDNEGTRVLIDVIWWSQSHQLSDVEQAMRKALDSASLSLESIQMLLRYESTDHQPIEILTNLGRLSQYDRPLGDVKHYDILLSKRTH